MNIAYLSADLGVPVFGTKGASIHLQELVNAFSDLGHRVTILAASRGAMSALLNAKVIKVEATRALSSAEAPADPEQGKARARELRCIGVATAMLDRLLELYDQKPFDMIYERYSLWSAAGIRASRKLGVPCLVEVNAPLVVEQARHRELLSVTEAEAIEAEVFGRASALLTVSEQVKAYAVSKGAPPEQTFVLPNAVDTKRFHPAVEPLALEGLDGKFVVGFVGSFKTWHGLDVLLDAFRTLRARSVDYHLLLVGDGPMRSWIDGYVRGAGLTGAVTITGWTAYERLPGLIQKMDVTVAPFASTEDFYFSPLKLFEYMAVGKPVVASQIGQIPELVGHETTGLLVRPDDAADLANKIDRLRREPDLRKSLGVAAAQKVAQHTWEQNARRVIALAEPLINKR